MHTVQFIRSDLDKNPRNDHSEVTFPALDDHTRMKRCGNLLKMQSLHGGSYVAYQKQPISSSSRALRHSKSRHIIHLQIHVLYVYCTPNDCSEPTGDDLLQLDFVCCLLLWKVPQSTPPSEHRLPKGRIRFLFEYQDIKVQGPQLIRRARKTEPGSFLFLFFGEFA